MTGDLSVKLGNGKKLEAAASNEVVESIGVTVAKVNEKFEIEEVRKTKGGREGEKKKCAPPSPEFRGSRTLCMEMLFCPWFKFQSPKTTFSLSSFCRSIAASSPLVDILRTIGAISVSCILMSLVGIDNRLSFSFCISFSWGGFFLDIPS